MIIHRRPECPRAEVEEINPEMPPALPTARSSACPTTVGRTRDGPDRAQNNAEITPKQLEILPTAPSPVQDAKGIHYRKRRSCRYTDGQVQILAG